MVHEFFDRLEKEIEDVSPDNGHGRKRFHDDPEKKAFIRRSTCHPETGEKFQ